MKFKEALPETSKTVKSIPRGTSLCMDKLLAMSGGSATGLSVQSGPEVESSCRSEKQESGCHESTVHDSASTAPY